MHLPTKLAVASALALAVSSPPAEAARVTVMTRNVAVGSALTPGLTARNAQELSDRVGGFLKEVEANDPAIRAKNLAEEIRQAKPDLVGLQEVAWWRTAPCSLDTAPPRAAGNLHDYLGLLLGELNRKHADYRAVVVQPQFDVEVPTNVDGDSGTGVELIPGQLQGCEANVRLTMRDVILARTDVRTSASAGGSFTNLLSGALGGVPIALTRGWTSVDATVRGGRELRFVNTQLESLEPSIRALQAAELFAPGGPATGGRPVVLVGDLSSDVATGAAQVLLEAGFHSRSTPLTCCLTVYPRLAADGGGHVSQFDRKTDHVLTDDPQAVRLVRSYATGLAPANGLWTSDHAGVVSVLNVK